MSKQERLYFIIFGKPESMKKAFPKMSQFYELMPIFPGAIKLYALTFSTDKSESLHPMIQAAMMIPGSWDIKTDLYIVDEWMSELGKPEDRHSGKGLHIERCASFEQMEKYILSCEATIVQL